MLNRARSTRRKPRLHGSGLLASAPTAAATALLALAAVAGLPPPALSQAQPTGPSGLQLPRFVSLKSDRVNMRSGPGTEYPTQWVYRQAGLPVEVIREYADWRQIRDSEGATGWVLAALLSGRRTAIVEPWEVKQDQPRPLVTLRSDDREAAPEVARVQAGVVANVRSCDGRWCVVTIEEFRGYLEQRRLWGVYKDEKGRW